MDEQRKSTEIDKLAAALVLFHSQCPEIKMDASNPFYRNRYATLHAILDAARPVLVKCQLSVTQLISGEFVDTMLIHSSGQWISGATPIKAKDNTDPQKMGSAITYARRYGLAAILSIAADPDDDANEAAEPWENSSKPAAKVYKATKQALQDAAEDV
jgi:hypothetical protein